MNAVVHPIVSWTTPYQRAETAFRAAAEHLEFGRVEQAMDLLSEHQAQVNTLLEFILAGGLVVRYGPRTEEQRERERLFDVAAGGRCPECEHFGGAHDVECALL